MVRQAPMSDLRWPRTAEMLRARQAVLDLTPVFPLEDFQEKAAAYLEAVDALCDVAYEVGVNAEKQRRTQDVLALSTQRLQAAVNNPDSPLTEQQRAWLRGLGDGL